MLKCAAKRYDSIARGESASEQPLAMRRKKGWWMLKRQRTTPGYDSKNLVLPFGGLSHADWRHRADVIIPIQRQRRLRDQRSQ